MPFGKKEIEQIVRTYPTPFYIYDEKAILDNARRLYGVFSWASAYKNYFAVKVLPNPHIISLLKQAGMGVDCSSLAELVLAERCGMRGEGIMFTSNNTSLEEFTKAAELKAIINLDDISHIPMLESVLPVPEIISFRFNPGPFRKSVGNSIIGDPTEAKFGMTKEQLLEGYRIMRDKGVKRFGLHTMVVSNELRLEALAETAEAVLDLVVEISGKLNITFEFINLGGGIGIAYKPEEQAVDLEKWSAGIRSMYEAKIINNNLPPLKIFTESGRMVTGPYGYLVTRVVHEKHTYKDYVGVDACMANLMRPGMYGAYHHISILGKEAQPQTQVYDVVGSLCENNDKFCVGRRLPKIEIGDILVIHDAGAHGHSMGFNYNGKLRSAELLLCKDGSHKLIRRAETLEDYFSTLVF